MEALYITKKEGKELLELIGDFTKIVYAKNYKGHEEIIVYHIGRSPVVYNIDGQHELLIR